MDFQANEIKVGATIFFGATFLIIFLIAIFGISFGEETNEYQIYLNNIGGIDRGSLVKYGGMDVGTVSEIALPDNEKSGIGLKIKVAKKAPVRIDSEAFVTSIGLMADQHIEISSGTPGAPLLQPGSVLKSKEVLNFMQMAEPLSEVSDQLQEMMDGLNALLGDKNRQHFSSMMANMDSLSSEGRKSFLKLSTNLEILTDRFAAVGKSLDELMARGVLEKSLENVETTTEEARVLITAIQNLVSEFQGVVSSNGTSIVDIMENFQFASQNLEEFTRIVKERPWLLVRKAAPPERKMP
ncbi:MAG: MCE family protein [Caldithrix sp.]|nr:MAG: MCE family protein [Caldithrix sp.]